MWEGQFILSTTRARILHSTQWPRLFQILSKTLGSHPPPTSHPPQISLFSFSFSEFHPRKIHFYTYTTKSEPIIIRSISFPCSASYTAARFPLVRRESGFMANLLSSVCTDPFKLKNPVKRSGIVYHGSRWSVRSTRRHPSLELDRRRKRARRMGQLKAVINDSTRVDDTADDYYAVLGLLPDATPAQIKKAYYDCMKTCHPDLAGENPETTNFCMFINEVYEVLSDPVQKMVYDEIHGYSLTATNPFLDDSSAKDHVFVDEFSCIGCKNCANVAPAVFDIEEDFGRARAYNQCGKSDLVQQAIESCPVDCIHWTSAAQLSLLEDEMRRVERVNVALMLSGMGSASADVFRMACSRWEKRQSKILEQARYRMMKEQDSAKSDSYWANMWGSPKDFENTEEEIKERAKRAAAAARRWREYSRRGADKPPAYKLPEAFFNKEWPNK